MKSSSFEFICQRGINQTDLISIGQLQQTQTTHMCRSVNRWCFSCHPGIYINIYSSESLTKIGPKQIYFALSDVSVGSVNKVHVCSFHAEGDVTLFLI